MNKDAARAGRQTAEVSATLDCAQNQCRRGHTAGGTQGQPSIRIGPAYGTIDFMHSQGHSQKLHFWWLGMASGRNLRTGCGSASCSSSNGLQGRTGKDCRERYKSPDNQQRSSFDNGNIQIKFQIKSAVTKTANKKLTHLT